MSVLMMVWGAILLVYWSYRGVLHLIERKTGEVYETAHWPFNEVTEKK